MFVHVRGAAGEQQPVGDPADDDVSPIDPVTFAAAPLFLLLTAALASHLPARRARHVAPLIALKEG